MYILATMLSNCPLFGCLVYFVSRIHVLPSSSLLVLVADLSCSQSIAFPVNIGVVCDVRSKPFANMLCPPSGRDFFVAIL
jgi:hypothetical protein